MRIYLTQPQAVEETTKGGVRQGRSYPKAGFYANVPEERGQAWIDAGVAFEATDDNKVLAWREGCDAAELVDLDEDGWSLVGLHYKQVDAPKTAEPEDEVELVDEDDEGSLSGLLNDDGEEGD